MSRKPRWNEKTRLLLTMELAVVLPAAALVVVSVLHLQSIQRSRGVEAAIQRDFDQVLGISEKQMNEKAYELADEVSANFPSSGDACSESLSRVLAAHPYVDEVFVWDPKTKLVSRTQPQLMKDPAFSEKTADFDHMLDGWMGVEYTDTLKEIATSPLKGEHGKPYYFFPDWISRGQKRMYRSAALFITGDSSGGKTAIAGFVFDADYLQNQFFPQMLNTVLSQQANEEKNSAVMMVRAKSDDTAISASSSWDGGEAERVRNLEGAFTELTLAIKLHGTTLAAIEQHFMRMSFLTLGIISLLLAGGLVLTHRNVSREVALARLKSDFVSNVSHELRTPLALIRLYAETLEMGRLTSPEKYQEYYRIIRKESERLSALINNILDFSRIEAGRKEYDFRETDIRELVCTTLDSYRYQIEQNGFVLEEKIDEDVPSMRVDREAIARSLVNLINNALKYSQNQKYIRVSVFRQNGSVKLQVKDRGIGISQSDQQKIFEKFYRAGDPLVHNTKGSGLGLSLVQHIVRAHGGDVGVESVPGQGSTFTIELPVQQEMKPQAASA